MTSHPALGLPDTAGDAVELADGGAEYRENRVRFAEVAPPQHHALGVVRTFARGRHLNLPAPFERAREGHVIRVFEVRATREPAGEPSHLHARGSDQSLDVQGCCLAFETWVRGHDDFLDFAGLQANDEFADMNVFWADPIHGV